MLASGERCADEVPDFDPTLCWVDPDGRQPVCVRPLSGSVVLEAERLRLIAEAFYRIATGRETRVGSNIPPPLEKWARNAGPELSAVVSRCMAAPGQADRLETFEAARSAIAGANSGSATHSTGASQGSKPKGLNHGLARVAGMHRLKALLEAEVIAPLRDPEPFKRYGLTVPNGILLYGPPGCGKTYIARQLAEELGHYFVEIIPSELASPYIHQSVVRIRELFDEAAANAPSVIFIDEFEAMTPSRSELGAHQQHKAEEVNEFLAHLNSCADKRIFVIAATNQPDKIDPAVRRTGRLDKLIYVGPPDEEARIDMLALHLKGRPQDSRLELKPLARALAGYSASDLKFLVDEAARNAFAHKTEICEDDFSAGMSKIRPSVPAELEDEYRSIEERG
jgi:transitional endoplasmic reticulum ATPase